MAKADKLVFDRDKYLKDISDAISRMLERVAKKFIHMMGMNLKRLNDFPSAWRTEVFEALDKRFEEKTEEAISIAVGLIDADESSFFTIRARVLEHGAGYRNDVGGSAIWHWQGVPGLNGNLDGYNLSDKASFPLPDEFNKGPGMWFRDAEKLIEEVFNDEVESLFERFDFFKYIHS